MSEDQERDEEKGFAEWAILELMGHRRVAGYVREVTLAGAGFLRLDIPATGGHGAQTQYIAPGSLYALHPTTEEIAVAAAANFRPQPVSRWELEPKRGDGEARLDAVYRDWPGESGDYDFGGPDDPDGTWAGGS